MDKVWGLSLAENKEMLEYTVLGHSLLFGKGVVNERYYDSPVTVWRISVQEDDVRVDGETRCVPTPDGQHIQVTLPETAVAPLPAIIISQLRKEGVLRLS
jgi:hypothetical protein